MGAGSVIQQLKAIASLDVAGFKAGVKEFVAEAKTLKDEWKATATEIATNATAKIQNAVSSMATKVSQAALEVNNKAREIQNRWNQTASSVFNAVVNGIGNAVARMAQMVARGANEVARAANPIGQIFTSVAGRVGQAASSIVTSAARMAVAVGAAAGKMIRDGQAVGRAWMTAARDIDRALTRTALVLGGTAAAAIGLGFKFNSMKEQARLAFATMLGNAQQADKFLASLFRFAEKTPFNAEGVIDGARKLLAMGFAAKEVLPTLENVSDAVSGLGGNDQMLDRVVRALGQIKTKGKLQAQEMMQLTENGIAAWDMLARHLNTTVADAMSRVTDGTVSADVAISAIMAGMQQKFGGLSQAQSKTFGGMLSNIQDFSMRAAGDITKPLFDAISQMMTRLLQWSQGGAFKDFVGGLRSQMAEFARWLQTNVPRMLQEIRAMGPAILEFVKTFTNLLAQLARFMVEHPKLLAMLIALKVGGFLGINQAALSTVKAIGLTVGVLGQAVGAAGALKAALAVGLVGAIALVVLKLTGAIDVLRTWIREKERAAKLDNQLRSLEERRHRAVMRQAEALDDNPAAKNAFLEKQIAEVKKNLDSLRRNAAAGDATADEQRHLDEVESRLADLEDARISAEEIASRRRAAQRNAVGGKALPTVAAPNLEDNAKAEEKAEEKAEKKAERVEESRQKKVNDTFAGFADTFDDFVRDGVATKQELESLFQEANKLRDAALAGRITQQQLAQGLETIEVQVKNKHQQDLQQKKEQAQLEEAAISTSLRFADSVRELARDGYLSADQVDFLSSRVAELTQQAIDGDITLDDLNRELSDLSWATNKAADAAKKAAEKEQELAKLRALAAGNLFGAGINPQEELLKRIAQLRMQQFNDAIERAARAALGLSDNMGQTSEEMAAFRGGMAGAMAGGGGGGGGGGFEDALSKLQQFLMSREGLVVSIKNQIALLQQNINTGRVFGFDPARIRQWEGMIQDLLQQLNALTETPTFSDFDTNAKAPVDPVLVHDANGGDDTGPGGVSMGRGGINITIAPNATMLTPAAADEAFELMRQAGYRRLGVDPFSRTSYR